MVMCRGYNAGVKIEEVPCGGVGFVGGCRIRGGSLRKR